ncbi:MAG: beta-glucuronidase [Oscillospiraceae bacterium]|nr:beta-glucuronidase [Oscillospiraceae bacterium]
MLYPIMTFSRTVTDLSGIWDFQIDHGQGFAQSWYAEPLPDPIPMPVPASYNDLAEDVAFRDHYGWVFYQRRIAVPEWLRNSQRVVLRCEAVTHKAIVYLNGVEICRHKGGFLPFETELNGHLQGDDLLTIAVDNRIDYTTLPTGNPENYWGGAVRKPGEPQTENYPNFDFFNYCGLTRPVRIYTTPKEYIEDLTLVSELHGDGATVRYEVKTGGEAGGDCLVTLLDREGREVCASHGLTGELLVPKAQLWQPLKPYLYTVRVRWKEDVYELPYGIRSVEVRGTEFLINGRSFYFKGYGKHEDSFPNGRGENLVLTAKDFSLMKWQGANSFRCSHYPYSEETLRLADREGFVVIDETPAVGLAMFFGGGANFREGGSVDTFDPEHGMQTFEHHREVIRDLIARDKNYACVVMWNLANEPDGKAKGAYNYFAPLFALARSLDPQRRPMTLSSVQMAGGPDTDVSARLSDVICLNRYYGWYVGGPKLREPCERFREELREWEALGKPLMITEYGADTVAGLHDTAPVMFTEEYQAEYYKANNAVLDEFPFVVGEHVWNFADFATSQGISRVQGNKKGIFTRDRRPKLAAHYFRERWRRLPDFPENQKS